MYQIRARVVCPARSPTSETAVLSDPVLFQHGTVEGGGKIWPFDLTLCGFGTQMIHECGEGVLRCAD